MSRIDSVIVTELEPMGGDRFEILDSESRRERFTLLSPDIATCRDCLREMADPTDPRHSYPFINCTNCGPRFTIILDIPYDRERTTMREFPLCGLCGAEYRDPVNRRFHAEPVACPHCGPQLRAHTADGLSLDEGALASAIAALQAGQAVAIKGIGGYHLACDADNEEAVRRLRQRKHREEKPLAVMARDLDTAREFCLIPDQEAELLCSPRAPILLMQKREGAPLAQSVAPANKRYGVMLPYAPLHRLLFDGSGFRALVMTSGNQTEEPIAFDDDDARRRLHGIADLYLSHNRAIETRCDDSIARVIDGGVQVLRRSRGYVPEPITLPFDAGQLLATGAELKNTFTLTRGTLAFPSHYIGDLKNLEEYDAFRHGIAHMRKLFQIEPDLVACDLHPDYFSTRYAEALDLPIIHIQHHYAHICSVMAEHGLVEPVIGVSFDGIGYGDDGTIWGGEFLVCDYAGYRRVGHLHVVPMPGGDAATREPWRMALSWLIAAFGDEWLKHAAPIMARIGQERIALIEKMVLGTINSPLTSSIGRLFDGVASLIGLRDAISFEGQAAMELEMHARRQAMPYRVPIADDGSLFVIDARSLIRDVTHDASHHRPEEEIAYAFHGGLADAVVEVVSRVAEKQGLGTVCVSGGVFQNALLTELTIPALRDRGLKVYINRQVPPNDGGISLGQAAVAGFRRGRDV